MRMSATGRGRVKRRETGWKRHGLGRRLFLKAAEGRVARGRAAGYASAAAVLTNGSALTASDSTQIVPTYIFGYEYSVSQKTGIVAQVYVSPSVYTHEDTDLEGLLATKYQVSVGVRHRIDVSVWTFAVTENVRNDNNTPDIGFQIGWTYSPAFNR